MRNCLTGLFWILILPLVVSHANAAWIPQASGVSDNLYGTSFWDSDYGFAVGWGASPGAVALRTTDGGENWESTILANGAFVFSVTLVDDLRAYAAGCLNGGVQGAVFKTTNGGDSWFYSSMPTTYGLYDVDFTTSTTGYACGWLGKIYKTTNSGNTWFTLNSGTTNVLRWMDFPDESTGYVVGGSNWDNPNRLIKTTNSGDSWVFHHLFSGMVIGGVHFFDADNGVVCGGSGGEVILKSTDGGETWTSKYSHATGLLQGLHFTDNGIGYACGNGGRVVRSDDYGETWTAMDPVVPSVTLLGVCGVEGGAYTVGVSGRIFSSMDPAEVAMPDPGASSGRTIGLRAYPNPFIDSTTLTYEVPGSEMVRIGIHDAGGRLIQHLLGPVQFRSSGRVTWDGTDPDGRQVPAGVYFYRVETERLVESQPIVRIE